MPKKTTTEPTEFLSIGEVRKRFNVSYNKLRDLANYDTGPKFYMFGKRRKYRECDIVEWMKQCTPKYMRDQIENDIVYDEHGRRIIND